MYCTYSYRLVDISEEGAGERGGGREGGVGGRALVGLPRQLQLLLEVNANG